MKDIYLGTETESTLQHGICNANQGVENSQDIIIVKQIYSLYLIT
jgi:hypothetical protein